MVGGWCLRGGGSRGDISCSIWVEGKVDAKGVVNDRFFLWERDVREGGGGGGCVWRQKGVYGARRGCSRPGGACLHKVCTYCCPVYLCA